MEEKNDKRIAVSLTEQDLGRLNELKSIFNEKTYSRVIQILIRISK